MTLNGPEREVDKEYLALLENKLQSIKDPKKVTTKQFLSDLASYKDQQLFHLITAGSPPSSGFDDDFADVVITPNYIRRVVAPQTCAISKQELVHLVKSDHVQKLHEAATAESETDKVLSEVKKPSETEKTKEKCDVEFDFIERKFLPFSEANQILIIRERSSTSKGDYNGLSHPIHTCLVNVYGRLHFVEENKIVCLPKLLGEKSLKSGHSIELCCADVLAENQPGSLAVLATFWVELNEHFCPCRHFGALFKISPTLHVELINKIEASAPVAHCRLVDRVINSAESKYWLIFEAGKLLSVYKLEKDCDDMTMLEGGFDEFPEVCLDEFAGAVTRSAMISSPKLKWCALGFDTGRVVLSVLDVETTIVHRKLIKFSGPVSVVMFVPEPPVQTPRLSDVGEDESTLEERFLVVSSTLGPVAIWRCLFEDGTLSWNNEILLSQSEQFDSITSACTISGNIAVGTYSGKILFYTSPCDLVSHEIASITQIHSPIVNMKVLDEKTLCVLSTAGLHTVTRSDL